MNDCLCEQCHQLLENCRCDGGVGKRRLEAENNELKEFICHLKDSAKGFTEDLEATDDLIATFDGFYVSYDKVIQACGGGTYGNDPLELIGEIINGHNTLELKVEELAQQVCDSCLVYEDDGTPRTAYGWNENREEGQIPCACISESGPYQVLTEKIMTIYEIATGERQVADDDTDALKYIAGLISGN